MNCTDNLDEHLSTSHHTGPSVLHSGVERRDARNLLKQVAEVLAFVAPDSRLDDPQSALCAIAPNRCALPMAKDRACKGAQGLRRRRRDVAFRRISDKLG